MKKELIGRSDIRVGQVLEITKQIKVTDVRSSGMYVMGEHEKEYSTLFNCTVYHITPDEQLFKRYEIALAHGIHRTRVIDETHYPEGWVYTLDRYCPECKKLEHNEKDLQHLPDPIYKFTVEETVMLISTKDLYKVASQEGYDFDGIPRYKVDEIDGNETGIMFSENELDYGTRFFEIGQFIRFKETKTIGTIQAYAVDPREYIVQPNCSDLFVYKMESDMEPVTHLYPKGHKVEGKGVDEEGNSINWHGNIMEQLINPTSSGVPRYSVSDNDGYVRWVTEEQIIPINNPKQMFEIGDVVTSKEFDGLGKVTGYVWACPRDSMELKDGCEVEAEGDTFIVANWDLKLYARPVKKDA